MRCPVNLLKNNPSLSHEMNLNNSIQTLEYEFARAIHSLTLKEVPRIAFIEGHGELDSLQTTSLMDELKNFFQVDRGLYKRECGSAAELPGPDHCPALIRTSVKLINLP